MSELRPNSATPPDPPAQTPTAMQFDTGLRLGTYRVVRLLGEGGMGFVYEAEDETLGRRVAVKVMRPEIAAQPDNRERFLREARAAAKLGHDRIVPIYHVGEHAGTPYIVMPLLAGRSLAGRLLADGRLPPGEVVRIGREVAEALAAARHDQRRSSAGRARATRTEPEDSGR